MKRLFYKIIPAVILAVIGALFSTVDSFAVNDYGIDYTLTSSPSQKLGYDDSTMEYNVTEDANRVNNLTPLIRYDDNEVTFSDDWQTGYFNNDGRCREIRYLRVTPAGDFVRGTNNPSFTISSKDGLYSAVVDIVGTSLDPVGNFSPENDAAIGVTIDDGWVHGGWEIYDDKISDTQCGGKIEDIQKMQWGNAHLFIETNIKVYRGEIEDEPYVSNGMYFGLTDIDAAQSYKILNPENIFSKDNMFAADVTNLQPSSGSLHNYFVPQFGDDESYIFSQYGSSSAMQIVSGSDIYVKLEQETQEDGLNIVFGFASQASSGIEYYAHQHTVTYKDGGNGSVSKDQETVIDGENPTGSLPTANPHYEFSHWVANKDVTLDDATSTTINQGEEISTNEIEQVIVTEDIEFTAYFTPEQYSVEYFADNNGIITGDTSESVYYNEHPVKNPTPSPYSHYSFDKWTTDQTVTLDDNNSTVVNEGEEITLADIKKVIVTEDISFTAHFAPEVYNVKYEATTGGSIVEGNGYTEQVEYLNSPNGATAVENDYYTFVRWTVSNRVELRNEKTIEAGGQIEPDEIPLVVVEKDLIFTAHFAPIQHTVTYAATPGGSVTVTTPETVNHGANPSGSEKQANLGYHFVKWTVDKKVWILDDGSIDADGEISEDMIKDVIVNEDLTFTAHFEANKYIINYEPTDGGTLDGTPTEQHSEGEHPNGSIPVPNNRYRFSHWEANTNVTLDDGAGTIIPQGQPITNDQISQVIIDKDIDFTAHFVRQYIINYESDNNGRITGETDETLDPNDHPSGSSQSSNKGYALAYWIADTDAVLDDGVTTIPAGEPITPEQITRVVVDKDITFTAVHVPETVDPEPVTPEPATPEVATPDTGSAQAESNTAQIATVSLFSILGSGIVVLLFSRVFRKKVDFTK